LISNSANRGRPPLDLKKGIFLAFEGIDGGGKTRQAFSLKENLEGLGVETLYVKEPTSGPWGRKVRRIAEVGRAQVSLEEELEWFIRDREEDVRLNIAPALARRAVVIADRYFYSTIAYQSALGLDPKEIRRRNAQFPIPDLVFLLEVPLHISQKRITVNRQEQANLGYEQIEYLGLVKKAYDALTDTNLIRLDSTRPPEVVAADIWNRVKPLLNHLSD
jgi:dTMP kinase